jgi:hypothetical protein
VDGDGRPVERNVFLQDAGRRIPQTRKLILAVKGGIDRADAIVAALVVRKKSPVNRPGFFLGRLLCLSYQQHLHRSYETRAGSATDAASILTK